MGPRLRRARNAVSSHGKKHLAARKKTAVNKFINNRKTCERSMKLQTIQSSENRECRLKGKDVTANRTVLGDATNKSPAARNLRELRTRKNVKYDSGLDSSSSSTSGDLAFDPKILRSPRSNKLNKTCYSLKNIGVSQTPVYKKENVLLENINELLEKKSHSSPEPACHQKTCVYKNTQDTDANLKPVVDMLPEEKLALYEFEVDENEPKRVKKKRKRRPRVKKPYTSDSEQSPIMSVVKQMRHLTTSNTNKDQNVIPTSLLSVCNHNEGPLDSQRSNKLTSVATVANRPILVQKNVNFETPSSVKINFAYSPIEKAGNSQTVHSPKMVRFANNSALTANSTQHTPVSFTKTDQTSASPNVGTPGFKLKSPRNRGVSSIYVRPNSNVHHKFVLDDSICSENEEPSEVSPKTPPNIRDLIPVKWQQRSRQSSMQHFFNTSNANEPNISSNSTKTNLDASGLFDDTSNSAQDQVPQTSRNLSLSFPSFVTIRKNYQFNHLNNSSSSSTFFHDTSVSQRESLQPHQKIDMAFDDHVAVRKKYTYVPRVSSFEPRDSLTDPGKELGLENCFGFDDDESEDETLIPLRPAASVANCKNKRPVSSTPYCSNVQPRPAGIAVRELKKILAPIVAKRPVYPRPSLQATNQSLTPTSVPSSVSSVPTNPKSQPVSPILNQSKSTSPNMLFSESKILTPVSFADDTPSEYFEKPARNSYGRSTRTKRLNYRENSPGEHETPAKIPKKKKREVKTKDDKLDLWAADINSHFNEIESMELCVE